METFDHIGGIQYFSTLDLSLSFHQIEINEEDREKRVFSFLNDLKVILNMNAYLLEKRATATFLATNE